MPAVPTLWWGFRFLDVFLTPFMWIFNKCRMEKPQETHPWHCTSWEMNLNKEICVCVSGGYERKFRFSPLFHIPLFGTGWEKYIVIRPIDYKGDWYVGWKALGSNRKEEINLLALKLGEPVRVLISKGEVTFFALNPQGEQIKLQQVGKGRLGDREFAHVRQF